MGIVWAGGANCPYPLLGGALAVVVKGLLKQGCQMEKFDPFLSLNCARVEGNFAA